MILYHGSRHKLDRLEKRQAGAPDNTMVPPDELLDAIYFTPDYAFAVACAARPDGVTQIDGEKKEIIFEHPELFDPEQEIFIYQVDSEKIPGENLKQIDGHQYTVVGLAELSPESIEYKKAGDVLNYYKIINWELKENIGEISSENKAR
jgi:hypothetical protein